MGTESLVEIARIFGLIVLVWFALVGWKLLPLFRRRARRERGTFGVA